MLEVMRDSLRDILQSCYLRSTVAHKQLARTSLSYNFIVFVEWRIYRPSYLYLIFILIFPQNQTFAANHKSCVRNYWPKD